MFAPIYFPADAVSLLLRTAELAIIAEEGKFHVAGRYIASESDAATVRRLEAEKRVRESLRLAARLGTVALDRAIRTVLDHYQRTESFEAVRALVVARDPQIAAASDEQWREATSGDLVKLGISVMCAANEIRESDHTANRSTGRPSAGNWRRGLGLNDEQQKRFLNRALLASLRTVTCGTCKAGYATLQKCGCGKVHTCIHRTHDCGSEIEGAA